MNRAGLTRLLLEPPVRGRAAVLCGTLLVAVPSLIRLAVDGVITGCEFTPYLPFVLLSAILLGWWPAALVSLAAVAVLGGLFISPHVHATTCFLSGAGIFLASSAAMIAVMEFIRRMIAGIHCRGADESAGGIIFSLEKGQVWASWYGQGPPVQLGSKKKVGEMMKDYLAQVELGNRLTGDPD